MGKICPRCRSDIKYAEIGITKYDWHCPKCGAWLKDWNVEIEQEQRGFRQQAQKEGE